MLAISRVGYRIFGQSALRIAAAAGVLAGVASSADAAMTLRVTSSAGGTQTIVDGGAGDTDLTVNSQILASPALTGYIVNIDAGFSNEPGNPTTGSRLQITNIAARDGTTYMTAPTLTIELTDEGFSIPTGTGLTLSSSGGGTLTNATGLSNVTFQSFADDADVLYGPTVSTAMQSFSSPALPLGSTVGFAVMPLTATAPFSAVGSFSLYSVTTIQLAAPLSSSTFTGTTNVIPEPASLALVAGIAGAGLLRRSRKA